MSSLHTLIQDEIHKNGPLPLDRFMELSLLHPEFGYYQKQQAIGSKGDFITAPEVSQMFGELIGLWCVDAWAKLGAPSKFALVEMGPGRGILMEDILRVTAHIPDFQQALQIHMVEASQRLQKLQQSRLEGSGIIWQESFPNLPADMPTIVIGNEFLDALPIKQFKFKDGKWQEVAVGVSDGALTYTLTPTETLLQPQSAEEGQIQEFSPSADEFIRILAERLNKTGGSALFVDYGPATKRSGDSFQALKDHKYTDPLATPGEADLTAHVQFGRLRDIALKAGCASPAIEGQGRFLERLGIEARVMQLSRKATEAQKKSIAEAHKRLVSEEGMGTLFKAFAFSSGLSAPLAGFGETK